jgi:hypothetical protein
MRSIPDCNSFDCRTKTVGMEESWIPNGPRFSLAQDDAICPSSGEGETCEYLNKPSKLPPYESDAKKLPSGEVIVLPKADFPAKLKGLAHHGYHHWDWNNYHRGQKDSSLAQSKSDPICPSTGCDYEGKVKVIPFTDNSGWSTSGPAKRGNALVQLNSDPICPSSGCEERKIKEKPMNYFVPNFGVDSDILEA